MHSTSMASLPSESTVGSMQAETSETFQNRMKHVVSYGYMVPCIALGYKLGLFDKMAEFTEPVTSEQLAEVMNFKERYVREWLSAMACLEVFEYNATSKTYFFQKDHHAPFVKGGGLHNVAGLAGLLPALVTAYPDLLTCFRNDGPSGIPAEKHIGVQNSLEDETDELFKSYINKIFELEPRILERLQNGITVCDMGCSNGYITQFLAMMFPNSTFHGCDIVEAAIEKATEASKESGLTNTSFSMQDICELPDDWCESFDLVIAFRVLCYDSLKALQHIHRCLKPEGILYMMDSHGSEIPVENSNISFRYTISLFHCLTQTVPREDSHNLGLLWSKAKAKQMLAQAGFSTIKELPDQKSYMNFVCDK